MEPAEELRYAFRSIEIKGTSEDPEALGPPYSAPWLVIDTRTSEPEVGWLGELVGKFDSFPKADLARWKAVLDIFWGMPNFKRWRE